MKLKKGFMRYTCCPMKDIRLHFFQHTSNLHRYSRSLVKYSFVPNHTKTFKFTNGPQTPNDKRLYGLVGHYGMYYTILQKDADRSLSNHIDVLTFDPYLSLNQQDFQFNKFIKFTISKLKQIIMNDISILRSQSRKLESPSLLLKRNFSTKVNFQDFSQEVSENLNEAEQDTFEGSQISLIQSSFNSGQLDVVYPIYQSLVRNNLSLPSVELYNIILRSIIYRDSTHELGVADLENKLTSLLTVYEDLLNVSCQTLKPNDETFNLVINELLEGSLRALRIRDSPNLPQIIYNDAYVKCQEFALIAIDLMVSVKNFQNLQLNTIYHKLFKILNSYPNIVSAAILQLIFNNLIKNSSEFEYYNQLIKLTKFFFSHQLLSSEKQCYDFILHNYQMYQTNDISSDVFKLYETMVVEFIKTNNFEVATQFLNTILNDFQANGGDSQGISGVLSSYLNELADIDLDECLKLANQFNELHYLPELSMSFYNKVIDKLVASNITDKYAKIWTIVNYNIVRKDFKLNMNLLNMAIDANDTDNVFKLTKILLLGDELIEPLLFKKLVNFYGDYSVVSNLIEHQAMYYKVHKKLNSYLSDIVNFLIPNERITVGNDGRLSYIVNSPFIKDCFNLVNLLEDQIYGVTQICKYLMNQNGSKEENFKAMNLKCLLYNEYESPEIVYVNLDEELTHFKQDLNKDITDNWLNMDLYSSNMLETAKYLDLQSEGKEITKVVPRVDLSLLLNINYYLGYRKFVELFNKGIKFNRETFDSLVDVHFLMGNHDWNQLIRDMIEVDVSLIKKILSYKIDNLTILCMKHLTEQDLIDEVNYNLLLDTLLSSDNRYLFEMFKKIPYALTENQIVKYLEVMNNFKDFQQVSEILRKYPQMTQEASEILNNDISNRIIKLFDNSDVLETLSREPELKASQQKVINDVLTKVIQLVQFNEPFTFKTIVRLLKALKLSHLSVMNFQKIIELLTMLKQESILNILLNKFIKVFEHGSLLRYDSLQVLIPGRDNKHKVLTTFKQSFQTLNCQINLTKIAFIENQHVYNE